LEASFDEGAADVESGTVELAEVESLPAGGADRAAPGSDAVELGAPGARAVGAGAGTVGAGGVACVRTRACAIAVTNAATTGAPADAPVAAGEADASEYVSLTTGTLRRTKCRRVTATRRLTTRLVRTVVVDAGRNAGAVTACSRYNPGTASCGNRATETDSAGSGVATEGASTAVRIDAPMTLTYGTESATAPTVANRRRCRRDPRLLRPKTRLPTRP
jgi:hypothetical protein